MYKRMLIPLDGSELAEILFPYAKELAGRLGLEMTFLYVCRPHESESLAVYRAYVEHVAEIIAGQVKEIREKAGIQTQDQPVKAVGEVVVGHPAEEILRYADEKEVDLLLMATHGRSGIKRWALGSVADKVLRLSTVPVWLVRAAALEHVTADEGQVRKILVPLDGSKLAESVLPHVEMLAKQWGVGLIDLVLFTVCEPLVIPPLPTVEMPVNWGNIVEEHAVYSKKAAGQYLAMVAARLNDAGLKVSSEVIEGIPAEVIINYANGNPYSLIAMATHGRSGLGRWAYGSVAGKVLSGASRPVFLVRPSSADGLTLLQTFVGTVRSLPPLV
jgi:nucleotide-binding universal stress UspA family protein